MEQGTRSVGVVVHPGREDALGAARSAVAQLQSTGVAVVGLRDDGWAPGSIALRDEADFGVGLDLVLAFGGDGTFLRAAWLARDCGVPLLGVNLGRLGFLSEVEPAAVPHAVERIATGDYDVEERMTLAIQIRDAAGAVAAAGWALNEASIERTTPQRLVVFEVGVGDAPFARIPADAVICATATGSTAYAFSAGGPILSPLVDAILLVPVAPHSLFSRTLVVDPAEVLVVRPADDSTCVVTSDGRASLPVPPGGSVAVSRGHAPVRMARLGKPDFYGRVRDKFGLR